MTNATRTFALLSFAIAAALLLAACGESQASDDGGVASLDESEGTASEAVASESPTDAEQALLEYVECLRGEGLDVPDPEVSPKGELEMRVGGPGGDDDQEQINPEEFEAAQEVCGEPPQLGGGDFSPEEQAAREDAALEFAQCMRDRGYDVSDPQLEGDGGVTIRGPGPDSDDPEQREAVEECQEQSFGTLRGPGGGPPSDDSQPDGNGS